ncbi:MAG: HAMP domain-containing protein [Planctomycetia bacterium]|nr:HAMP domain-containing protein [Candidatus Brocadia sp.]QOJ05586.1 MAG: HAMP domain-containing protein [Planctomycetia bacterium]TVL98494.1 MAG: histidine kinase [Candidatus Brocadia sp. BL1]HQU29886.1 ATP-binding protein [Candidatus Brocadia sapporoensis]
MVKNSLWKRIFFGYITIVIFMMIMSFYLIYRLNYLNKVTDSIMRMDIPFIENGERLVDCFFEQVRNEKKYLITNDNAFLDLFDQKKKEFLERLKYLEESTTDREKDEVIHLIREPYKKYLSIVSKEIILVGQDEVVPPDIRYEEEKKKTLDQITESINKLILITQMKLIKKIGLFQKIGYKSTQISFVIILFAVLFGAVFAYFFTRSICSPIKILKDATEHIAQGDLDHRIEVTASDEIGMLGMAFNQMCNKLKEMDQMKTDFVSNVSHDLKTPLTVIREANDLLLKKIAGPISDKQIKLLNITKAEIIRLTMMINDLLDISRIEAGLMRYNFQESSIQDIIRKSVDEIRFLAENKKIHILWKKGGDIPKVLLDREKTAQVMDNLLSNAIKFTPSGGKITITVCEVDSKTVPQFFAEQSRLNNIRSFVQISISDTGIGIPAECHKTIFDKFQQVSNKGKGGMKGTGLGLSIVKHIILDHGGDLWVESKMGEGSTFCFVLPFRYDYALHS